MCWVFPKPQFFSAEQPQSTPVKGASLSDLSLTKFRYLNKWLGHCFGPSCGGDSNRINNEMFVEFCINMFVAIFRVLLHFLVCVRVRVCMYEQVCARVCVCVCVRVWAGRCAYVFTCVCQFHIA